MKQQNKSIPIWIWIVIIALVLMVALLWFLNNNAKEVSEYKSSEQRNWAEQCGINLEVCQASVRVLNENRDCFSEYQDCLKKH